MTSIHYFVYHIVVVRFSPEKKKKDHNNLVPRTSKTRFGARWNMLALLANAGMILHGELLYSQSIQNSFLNNTTVLQVRENIQNGTLGT